MQAVALAIGAGLLNESLASEAGRPPGSARRRKGLADGEAKKLMATRQLRIPDDMALEFSRWQGWNEARGSAEFKLPGVYLLAHFPDGPPPKVDPIAHEIAYIGETCGQDLRKRLRQFGKSATDGKRAHAGGRNYFRELRSLRSDLFVATLSTNSLDREIEPAFIRYIERKLIWEYARKWNAMPCCNRK